MRTITLRDGAKLKVVTGGHGRTLVLISGLGGTARFWQPLVQALGSAVQTVCFDQRGINGSERGTEPVSVASLAKDSWEIIDALEIERPILCGHSTGGAIVQEMVLARPGTADGIVLSGSWAGPDAFVESMFQIRLDRLATLPNRYAELSTLLGSPPRWHHERDGDLHQQSLGSQNKAELDIIRERIEALLAHNCRYRLNQLAIPALILGAEDDMIIPPYLQEELASLLKGSHLHIFDNGGHFFPVTRPADTSAIIQRWLPEATRSQAAL